MSLIKAFLCRLDGHDERVLLLPEDGWGLYAYSRIECSRCGTVIEERDPFDELARYNADRARGVAFEPWKVERMAVQQEYFDEQQRSVA